MYREAIKEEWKKLLDLVDSARAGSDHPEVNAFLDAMQQHATAQCAFMDREATEAISPTPATSEVSQVSQTDVTPPLPESEPATSE